MSNNHDLHAALRDGKQKIRKATGFIPNVLVVGEDVRNVLGARKSVEGLKIQNNLAEVKMSRAQKILLWLNKVFTTRWAAKPKKPDFVDNGVYITHDEFLEIMRTQLAGKLAKDVYIRHADSEYYCPSIEYCKHLIELDKTDRETYAKNIGDCDKFSWTLKYVFVKDAWRKGVQRASHCVGVFDYVTLTGSAHSVNYVIDDTKILHIVEPQSDEWFSPKSNKIKRVLAIIP